jgi:hypothetical protein
MMSCVAQRTPAWERPGLPFGAVSDAIIDRLIADGDRAYAAREEPTRLDEALEDYRAALRYRPSDVGLLVRLSRAARARAATVSGSDGRKQLAQAVAWAERALAARNPAFLARTRKPPEELFAVAEVADVPALAAYAEALLDWSERQGTATFLRERPLTHAAAIRLLQLDRAAEHAAADRLLGALDAAGAPDLGGDLRAAEEHYEAALAGAPGFLPTRLDYADRYAVRMRDGKLYDRLLREVSSADADALPEAIAENRAAQKRARRLLQEAGR